MDKVQRKWISLGLAKVINCSYPRPEEASGGSGFFNLERVGAIQHELSPPEGEQSQPQLTANW